MFWQVDQGRFPHFGRTLVLDALDLLQGLVDGSFVGQQGISDVELAFLFGGNGRHAVQRAWITAVVGKANLHPQQTGTSSRTASASGKEKGSARPSWSRRFGNGTLRFGVLLHHPRLLS